MAKQHRLYCAVDGQTFELLDTPNGLSWIRDIEVSPSDADHVWVTLSNYNSEHKVLESTDGAFPGPITPMGFPLLQSIALLLMQKAAAFYHVGTDVGVSMGPSVQWPMGASFHWTSQCRRL